MINFYKKPIIGEIMYSKDFEEFEPVHLLELAISLYNNLEDIPAKSSAIKRTIANRVYFASFLHLRRWFINNKNYESKGPLDHSYLPNEIIGNTPMFRPFEKDLRDKIIILGKNRRVCDYEFKRPTFSNKNRRYYQHTLADLIEYSKEIIETFNKFDENS